MRRRVLLVASLLAWTAGMMPVDVVTAPQAQAAVTRSCSVGVAPYWVGYCTATVTPSGTGAFVDKITLKFDRCLANPPHTYTRLYARVGSLGGGVVRWEGQATDVPCGVTWYPSSRLRPDGRVYAYDGDRIVAEFEVTTSRVNRTRTCSKII